MIRMPYISNNVKEEDFIGKASGDINFNISVEEMNEFFTLEMSTKEKLTKLRKMGGIAGIHNILKINTTEGINADNLHDLVARVIEFGDNSRIDTKTRSLGQLLSLQFKAKIHKFLLYNAIVYFIVDNFFPGFETGLEESVAILILFSFLSLISFLTTYIKYKKYLHVVSLAEFKEVRVIRNGKVRAIPSNDLVVGDIMFIDNGDIIPVDGILTKSNDILCFEYGEQIYKRVPIKFSEEEKADPFILSGTKILEGQGVMIVCAVGVNCKLGKIKLNQVSNDLDSIYLERETKLMKKIGIIYSDISKMGLISAVVTFIVMTIHFILDKIISGESLWTVKGLRHILNNILIMFAIIIVILPEGLQIALSSAITYAIVKLRDKNSLVRYFSACETLGYVNNICSDQTGIFTKNKMSVRSIFIEEVVYNCSKNNEFLTKDSIQLLCECICINSTASPKFWGNGEVDHNGEEIECALLEFAYKLGYNYEDYRPSSKIKKTWCNSSERKSISTIYQNSDYDFKLYTQGIHQVMLDKCNYYLNYKGNKVQMNEEFRDYLEKSIIKNFSKKSLKPIVLAYKDINTNIHINSFENYTEDSLQNNLILIALIGIKDPMKDDVPEAVSLCNVAGITVRMVTSDPIDTAISIAKDCGILPITYDYAMSNTFAVMEGKDFRQYVGVTHNPYKPKGEELNIKDLTAFEEIVSDLKVLARATPEDKYLLISGLKELGNVVALSGVGANDVNALRKADVGFAMGVTGCDIAKDVSDVILLDDNLSSIVTSIKWGRNIFEGIRKFLQLVLCINLIFIILIFIGGISHKTAPMAAIHMIWIDFLLNVMASLALATENPSEDILMRPPFTWDEYIISPFMRVNIIFQVTYGTTAMLFLLFYGEIIFNLDPTLINKRKTIIFNALAYLLIFNQINSRKIKRNEYNVFRGAFQNKLFFLILGLMILLHTLFVNYGGNALECDPLSLKEFLQCIGIGAGSLIVGFLARILPENLLPNLSFLKQKKKSLIEDNM